MQAIQLVEFTRSSPPYNKGETAGFSPERAARFVKAGFGKLTDKAVRRPNTCRPATEPKVVMRFLRTCPPYMKDETAGFTKSRAAQLEKKGLAEFIKGDELKVLQARLLPAKLLATAKHQPPPIKAQGKR